MNVQPMRDPQEIQRRFVMAIQNPHVPFPLFEEIKALYDLQTPSVEEIKSKILSAAPVAVRNAYYNLRDPQKAQLFFEYVRKFPKRAAQFVGILKSFVPFILPSEEMFWELDYEEKRKQAMLANWEKAWDIYMTGLAKRNQITNDLITNTAHRLQFASFEDLLRLASDISGWHTEVSARVVPYLVDRAAFWYTKLLHDLQRASSEEERVVLQNQIGRLRAHPFLANFWDAIESRAQSMRGLHQYYLSSLEAAITEMEKYSGAVKKFGIQAPTLDLALQRAKNLFEEVKKLPPGQFFDPEFIKSFEGGVENVMRSARDALNRVYSPMQTLVQKLNSQIGNIVQIIWNADKKELSTSISILRNLGQFGSDIAEGLLATLVDEDDLKAKLELLRRLRGIVEGVIQDYIELGLGEPRTLEPLLELINWSEQELKRNYGIELAIRKIAEQQKALPAWMVRDKRLELAITYQKQMMELRKQALQRGLLRDLFMASRGYLSSILSVIRTLMQNIKNRGTPLDNAKEMLLQLQRFVSLLKNLSDPNVQLFNPDLAQKVGPLADRMLNIIQNTINQLEDERLTNTEKQKVRDQFGQNFEAALNELQLRLFEAVDNLHEAYIALEKWIEGELSSYQPKQSKAVQPTDVPSIIGVETEKAGVSALPSSTQQHIKAKSATAAVFGEGAALTSQPAPPKSKSQPSKSQSPKSQQSQSQSSKLQQTKHQSTKRQSVGQQLEQEQPIRLNIVPTRPLIQQ